MATTSSGQEQNSSADRISQGPFNSVVFRLGSLAVVIILLGLLAFRMFGPNLHGPATSGRPPGHPSETNPSSSSPAVAPAPNK